MMNPAMLIKMKSMWDRFKNDHPKGSGRTADGRRNDYRGEYYPAERGYAGDQYPLDSVRHRAFRPAETDGNESGIRICF